jgi:tagatose 1,6-diphosphate aldolase GatY/KbaY
MLVSPLEILSAAQAENKAVGAFNIENMEMAKAVIDAANEANTPVMLQTTSSTLKYASPAAYAGMVAGLAEKTRVPITMHLDHGNSFSLAAECITAGYTSVMFDGSLLSFEENIRITKQVADAAGEIPVEAELGSVGGKEDDHEAENAYTDPEEAAEFVSRTGVRFLAIAIGTAHGVYNGTPKLDIPRLIEIRKRVSVPLVLHGASGLSGEVIRECIREGICKVNFATELRIAYSDGVKAYLLENPAAYDPKSYGKAGYEAVKKTVHEKLNMLKGSA